MTNLQEVLSLGSKLQAAIDEFNNDFDYKSKYDSVELESVFDSVMYYINSELYDHGHKAMKELYSVLPKEINEAINQADSIIQSLPDNN